MNTPEPVSDGGPLFPQWPLSEPAGDPPPRVAWVTQSPLNYIGAWEPLSFRKRAGYAWADEDDAYLREFSDEAFDQYLALGATGIVIPYAKGFGRTFDQHEFDQERDFTARARARELRVGAYVRTDALVPETIRADYPDVDEWLMRGSYDRPSVYHSQQTWRRRVCYSHPRAVSRLEEILRYAIETLKIDSLHLDGYQITYTMANTCRCELCLAQYRRWLHRRYPTRQNLEAIFGVINPDELQFPLTEPGANDPVVVNSPDIRAWARFQWDRFLAFTRHVRRYTRSLNDEVALTVNPPGLDINSNASLVVLQNIRAALPWFDMVMSEDVFHLHFTEGRVVSRIASFKLAREAGLPLGTYHWMKKPRQIEASLALSTAANGGHLACLGFSIRYLHHAFLGRDAKTRHARWARDHWDLLGNTRPVGDVAVLRHQPSMAWNGLHPWQAAISMEAMLSQRLRVPWRMFGEIDPSRLAEVGTLLAPDAECLGDGELDQLRTWVEAGGRLFFTTRTARYDQERRRRPRHPVLDWSNQWRAINDATGPETWFDWMHDDVAEFAHFDHERADGPAHRPSIAALGKGRLGWWPLLRYDNAMRPHLSRPENFKPPLEADALYEFLGKLHGTFSLRVDGPAQLVVEVNRPANGKGRLVHLIRADEGENAIDATIYLDQATPASSVKCLGPDDRPPRIDVDGKSIRVSALNGYAVIHLPD